MNNKQDCRFVCMCVVTLPVPTETFTVVLSCVIKIALQLAIVLGPTSCVTKCQGNVTAPPTPWDSGATSVRLTTSGGQRQMAVW